VLDGTHAEEQRAPNAFIISIVTPKGALPLAMRNASATREGL
jgi:hypothetical protein